MLTATPFINYLKQLQAKGETHVPINDDARQILREFYIKAKQVETSDLDVRDQKVKLPVQPAVIKKEESLSAPAPVLVFGGTSDERLVSLKALYSQHLAFKQLGTLRQQLVFPELSESSDIMMIGEAPGYHEERQSKPFAGPAGEKLDGILRAMGLDRKKVHITTIVKFRPATANQTTNNRPASTDELEASREFIEKEIQIVNPKVIITLGAPAARFFTQTDSSLDELRLSEHQYKGIPIRPTYHPSHLLHQEDTEDKRKVWEDMLSVMDLLAIPISEKQRGFFKKKK